MRIFQGVKDTYGEWNRSVRVFFLANMLYQIGTGMFSVLYNLYVQSLGYHQEMNGTIISVQSLATALVFIPVGWLGDRISRMGMLICGALFTGLFFIGRSYSESSLGLESFAFLSGLAAAFFQVLAVPFLAGNAGKAQRLKLFSYHFSATLAAQVLGSIGGGFLADLLHGGLGLGKTGSLQIVLLLGSVFSLVSSIPLLWVNEKQRTDANCDDDRNSAATTKKPPVNTGDEWNIISKITFSQLLVGIGSGLVVPYLNLYFTDRFNVSLSAVGLLISLGQVMTIFSMLIGPSLVRRVGQIRAVVIFQALSLPFLLITGFTNVLLVASLTFLFRQALMNAANPIQSAILVDRISDSRRGIANSLTQTVFMIGWASMGLVQPRLISEYGTYWGYVYTFCITGALYISAALYFYFTFRGEKKTARFA